MRLVDATFVGLLLGPGCAEPPDPCQTMCLAASELYGGCLNDWGVDWTSAGYDDADHFEGACQTWAWTTRMLEAEAERAGQVDAVCRERRDLFTAGECSDFTTVDWSELPWSSTAPLDTGIP